MNKTRIELSDTIQDIVVKLAEGNPGALSVCVQMLTETEKIDPDAILKGLSGLLMLDTLGIYGSEIWILYKDVCGEDITDTIAILRGFQLGIVTENQLHYAIQNRGNGLDINDVLNQVKKQLPNFVG